MSPAIWLLPQDDDGIPSSRPSSLPPTRRERGDDAPDSLSPHISDALLELVERACSEDE
jgi:hypothetical protein